MIILFLCIQIILAVVNATIFINFMNNWTDLLLKYITSKDMARQFKRILFMDIFICSCAGGVETYRYYSLRTNDLTINRWILEISHSVITSYTSMIENYLGIMIFALAAYAIIAKIKNAI